MRVVTVFYLFIIGALGGLATAGWFMNLIELLTVGEATAVAEVILRLVGVFAFPLGALLGWFL